MKYNTSIETLETRIVPARIFGIDGNNGFLSFDSADPTVVTSIPLSGIESGQVLRALDFRPATGELYGMAYDSQGSNDVPGLDLIQFYKIATATGVATPLPQSYGFISSGSAFGMDFDPVTDTIRVTENPNKNYRFDPTTGGGIATDTSITGASQVAALAYTNNYPGATSTTLYAVDYTLDDLHIIGGKNGNPSPNGGVGTKVADISVSSFDAARTSLDILTALEGNVAFYAIKTNTTHRLYNLDLVTGAASLIGTIGDGNIPVFDIAVQTPAAPTFPDGKSFTYTDGDGDRVTVKTSAGTLKSSQFGWRTSADGTRHEMLQMSITGDATFTKANLTFTAKKTATGGDGRVDIGTLDATGLDLGAVKIGGNIERINAGSSSATVPALKSFSALSMGRGTLPGDFTDISSFINTIAPVASFVVKGDITGISLAIGKVGSFTVGGSIISGAAAHSGDIRVKATKTVSIGGSLIASSSGSTGNAVLEAAKSITIGGSLIGGPGFDAGNSNLSAPAIKIGGSIIGSSGEKSGNVSIGGNKSFQLAGSIVGGDGSESGFVTIFGSPASVKVGGSVIGGDGSYSGHLEFDTPGSVTVGGSLFGSSGFVAGVIEGTSAKSVKIGGSIQGGTGAFGAAFTIRTVGSFALGGSVVAGDHISGTILGTGTLTFDTAKTITIKGGLIGNNETAASILIQGKLNPATGAESIAIGSLTIGGSVIRGQILIGSTAANVNAAADKITVGGDFLASTISAGFRAGNDNLFGTADDNPVAMGTLPDIKAAIGSIIIKGRASGTSSEGDHYGIVAESIVAESIGSVSIGGRKLALTAAAQDNVFAGIYGDFRVRENLIA